MRIWLNLAAAAAIALSLAACGSTKVYTADKTVVYRDSIYNLSNVSQLSTATTATLPDGSERSIAGIERNDFNDLLDDNDSVRVKMAFELDDRELVYRDQEVDDWRLYDKMRGDFEDAAKDLRKFMGNKKKTQLTLR